MQKINHMANGDIHTSGNRHKLTPSENARGGANSRGVPKRRIDKLFRAIEKAQKKKIPIKDKNGNVIGEVEPLELFSEQLMRQMANGNLKAGKLYIEIITNGEAKDINLQGEVKATWIDALVAAKQEEMEGED